MREVRRGGAAVRLGGQPRRLSRLPRRSSWIARFGGRRIRVRFYGADRRSRLVRFAAGKGAVICRHKGPPFYLRG